MLAAFSNRFLAGADVELVVDVFDVGVDRVGADGQLGGDFLVGQAPGQALQDFALALGQSGRRGRRGRRRGQRKLLKLEDDLPGNARTHRGATLLDRMKSAHQLPETAALEHIARSPGLDGRKDRLALGGKV